MNYQDINSKTIDRWVEEGWEWGKPISVETFKKAQDGIWDVLLTPTKFVPHHWFGELKGKKLLGLASGGAQQIPIFCALGADCVVLDNSKKQIESEIEFSKKCNYKVDTIIYDMTKRLPFEDETFDIIFHPVSNCYVEKVEPIFKECYRILKKGGVLLCGLDNGINYIFDEEEVKVVNKLPFNPLVNENQLKELMDTDSGIQFSHTIEEQIGGQLKAGFMLVDLYEDTNGSGNLHEHNIPSFLATKALKI